MILGDLRAKLDAASDERRWWRWRFLDAVLQSPSMGIAPTEDDRTLALDCFVDLANEDPDWATAKLGVRGPESHAFSQLFGGDRLETVLARVRIQAPKADAMLRARILIACASWARSSESGDAVADWWRRSWTELQRIDTADRDAAWDAAALPVTAHTDYGVYKRLADAELAKTKDPFTTSMFLAEALPIAARHGDWTTFDRWHADYCALPAAFRRDHSECAILNIEGVRALEAGRLDDADTFMTRIVELAPKLQFLSNADVSELFHQLRGRGRAVDLCDQFEELMRNQDWRLFTG